MGSVFELGCDLNEVVIIELDLFGTFVSSSDVDLSISKAEVVGALAVEIPLDSKDLQNEGSFEACADVYDGVV